MSEFRENNSKLGKFEELLSRSGIDPNDLEHIDRLNVWQGFIKNADGEIETVDLFSIQAKPGREDTENPFIQQAAPVNIFPGEVKPVNRKYKEIFAFGDSQIGYRNIHGEYVPTHDEKALKVARFICQDLRPDVIVNLGDTVELPTLSRFAPDSNHFTSGLQRGFDRTHQLYGELRADNPNAEIHEVDSNHNTRLGKFVLKNVMDFYGLHRAGYPEEWPVLSYPFLANLDALDVQWHSGYGAAEFKYSDDLVFTHGTKLRSNGSSAQLYNKELYPDTNVVFGHGHRMEQHFRTNRVGKYIGALMVGVTCRIDGFVPSYGSSIDDRGVPVERYENWQQGVMVARDYGNGDYEFQQIPIKDGRAFYNGQEYGA